MMRGYDTFPNASANDSTVNTHSQLQHEHQVLNELQQENGRSTASLVERNEQQKASNHVHRKHIIAHRGLTTLPEFSVSSNPAGASSVPLASQTTPVSPTVSSRRLKHPHPENTLPSILHTLRTTGVDALEIDVHLSSDSVPVLSHDATLKRVLGDKRKICEVNAEELEGIGLVRLETVLEILRDGGERGVDGKKHNAGGEMPGPQEPRNERLGWDKKDVLLDIKIWNPVSEVVGQVAEVIRRVYPGNDAVEQRNRVKMGVWTMKYARACVKHNLPIVHISRSIKLSREFLDVPGIAGFNIHWSLVATKEGRDFLVEANERNLPVWVWTVNDAEVMKWVIADRLITGICTDDAGGAEQLCAEYEKGVWKAQAWSWRLYRKWWIWCGINHLVGLLIKALFKDKL